MQGPGQFTNIFARNVVIEGAPDGLFIYLGTPATGNLIASGVPIASFDIFNLNTTVGGLASYRNAGGGVFTAAALDQSELQFWTSLTGAHGSYTNLNNIGADTAGNIEVTSPGLKFTTNGPFIANQYVQLVNGTSPGISSGNANLFCEGTGHPICVAGDDGNGYNMEVLHITLPSTSITAVTPSFTTIGSAIPVAAREYKIHIRGMYTAAAAGTPTFGLATPALILIAPMTVSFHQNNSAISFAAMSTTIITPFSGATMAGAVGIMFDYWAFVSFSASGTIQFEANTSAAIDTYTFNGGMLELYPVN